MMGWTVFYNPMALPSGWMLWLMLPLCVSVAVVYRAIRLERLERFAWSVLGLVAYMVAGLVALGAGLWLVQEYWP